MTQAYPGYPPQGTAPQYPQQQPAYPQQPPQAYPQQPQPAYAQPQQFPVQQGYPAPMMAPPQPPLAQGSIDDFFNQPSTGGGKSLTFETPGTRYIGIVTRPLGPGDVQQQTAQHTNAPLFFKDGRPKFVMKVPLQMQPNPSYPDGLGTWFVKGQARDELVRAMSEAGAPAGPPEAGSIIDVTFTGTRSAGAGFNPAKLFAVVYTRPSGETSSPAPQVQAQQPTVAPSPAPVVQQPSAFVQLAAPEIAAMQQAPVQQYAQQAPVQQYAPPAAPQVPAPAAAPQAPVQQAQQPAPPADLSQEQQALLAKLTGG